MLNDLNCWRLTIGLFGRNSKCVVRSNSKNFTISCFDFFILIISILISLTLFQFISVSYMLTNVPSFFNLDILSLFTLHFFLIAGLLLLCGDVESNPGPKDRQKLSVIHWNLNSLSVHDYIKLSSLQAFNTLHKFDLICLSETFFDSSISSDNPSLALNGYRLIRSDHPNNIKRGGVCIYYKESLPIKFLNISNLKECLVCEIIYDRKKCYLVSLYRSPSQDIDEFDYFMREFENIINNISNPGNPNLILIVGDFNAKLSTWKLDDNDTFEGIEIGNLTSSYGLVQIISDATHVLPTSSSCIDLIFTNQPNMITKSGVYPSLHSNCHHQITYADINFKTFYPPPYERTVWHFSRANVDGIKLSVTNIDWERVFSNINVDEQVTIFNTYLINIFHNFIPNEVITIDDRDPPWMTSLIKKKFQAKDLLYQNYLRYGRSQFDYEKVEEACHSINNLILDSKNAYYRRMSNKLSDPKTSPKAYWSILKSFFCDKKTPIIPPILINGEYITNFKAKADIFNTYFSNQCTLLNTSSVIPNVQVLPLNHRISTLHVTEDVILKHIRNLDTNKSHGIDNISAKMLKICDISIVKPLKIIFNNSLNEGVFPNLWKKANITPIHKKGDKNDVKNYRPISVLPLCGKLFEKLIYDALYSYFENNNIFDINQSGFRKGDSCVNQLISITHDIFKALDSNPSLEVRGVFLDISKAFDRVWHEGILFKLASNGVEGKMLTLIESFLNNRQQRVVLNGQCSSWENIKAGVPQGSILGPLLFLIYINDISHNLESNVKLFADDTSIFSIVHDPNISGIILNRDLDKIHQWAYQWKMSFNPDPSKQAHEMIFSKKINKPVHPDLSFNQLPVERVVSHKHLGLILDEKLNFNSHLKMITDKATKGISVLRKLRHYIPRNSLITTYKSFIRSHLEYGDIVFDQPNNASFSEKLESIQYNAALAITGAVRGSSKVKLYEELGLENLKSRRWFRRLCSFYKIIKTKSPSYLYNLIPHPNHYLNTRNQYRIPNFFCRTESFNNSFFPSSINNWNAIAYETTQSESFSTFRKILLKSIKPIPKSIYDACDPLGIQLLTRLRVGLSHLRDHKFRHGFNDIIDPLCPCNMELESVSHFYLECQYFINERTDLMNELRNLNIKTEEFDVTSLINLLLYGDKKFSNYINSNIINLSIKFIKETKRFEGPLF